MEKTRKARANKGTSNIKVYDFTSKEQEFGRVVFALTLDRKKLTERIVIGKEDEVRRLINGIIGADNAIDGNPNIYYDKVRPLGSLLVFFEADPNGDWNRRIHILTDSYKKVLPKILPKQTDRWSVVAPVSEFLRAKYETGEPSAMFAAIRTWEEYLNLYNQNHGATLLSDRLFMLYKPFMIYGEHKPWQSERETAADTQAAAKLSTPFAAPLSLAIQNGESSVELRYPVNNRSNKRAFETVITHTSLLPIIAYYAHKINEWRLVFQQCKVCEKHFAARSRHYELCSDKCRKQTNAEAKREHRERTKGDTAEQQYNSAYTYWSNRYRKLEKIAANSKNNADNETAAAFKAVFETFRKEAIKRKKMVKSKEMTLADFSSWLAQQKNEADSLVEKLTKPSKIKGS